MTHDPSGSDDSRRLAEDANRKADVIAARLDEHLKHCTERWQSVQSYMERADSRAKWLVGLMATMAMAMGLVTVAVRLVQ